MERATGSTSPSRSLLATSAATLPPDRKVADRAGAAIRCEFRAVSDPPVTARDVLSGIPLDPIMRA